MSRKVSLDSELVTSHLKKLSAPERELMRGNIANIVRELKRKDSTLRSYADVTLRNWVKKSLDELDNQQSTVQSSSSGGKSKRDIAETAKKAVSKNPKPRAALAASASAPESESTETLIELCTQLKAAQRGIDSSIHEYAARIGVEPDILRKFVEDQAGQSPAM